jgi:uncharacterized protein (DUF433 family)
MSMNDMGKPVSQWALGELCRLAERDPQRAERIMEALWSTHPRLLGELAISAVDLCAISAEEAAGVLGVSAEEVRSRVDTFRKAERPTAPIVEDDGSGIARLAEGHVPVWEVVREYRKSKSIDKVAEAFPALTAAELKAAIDYGDEHAEVIGQLIEKYEGMQDRKRAEYPFAK